jgi:hypothetical protein
MNVRPCIDAQRYEAPTGRKGIAQGKAKRRPGFRDVIKSRALKGRNRRCVSRAMMFRPFRALANWGGVPPRVALRSTLGYLIMPLWGVGIDGSMNEARWFYAPLGRTIPLRIGVDPQFGENFARDA